MNKRSKKIERTLMAMLLMFVLSFGTVFATDETTPADTSGTDTQVEATTPESGSSQTETPSSEAGSGSTETPAVETGGSETPAVTPTPAPAPAPKPAPVVSNIIKKGKYYYYRNPKTKKIRKKKGFVRDNGNLYYIGKKGRIVTGKQFKVKKKYYRAYKNGVIATGVYTWKKKLNYSNPSNGQWIKSECIVSWNGDRYYIQKGGKILVNDAFGFKNLPYKADASGRVTQLAIPDNGNVVTNVAKKQVGIMTGKTYWKWYFKTKFKNTDATPWCGAFVAWCFNAAGVYDKVTPIRKFGNLGYVPSYSKYANSGGKWISQSDAQGGDIIIYSGSRHVGLVEGISDGCLVTIEGNSGPTSLIRGKPGAVVRKAVPLNSWKIKGVIRVF